MIRTTLADLDPEQVDMLSLVIIGSSTTRWTGERMVTPRGYPRSGGHPTGGPGPPPGDPLTPGRSGGHPLTPGTGAGDQP